MHYVAQVTDLLITFHKTWLEATSLVYPRTIKNIYN